MRRTPSYGVGIPIDLVRQLVADADARVRAAPDARYTRTEAIFGLRLHVDAALHPDAPVAFPKQLELARNWRWTRAEVRALIEAQLDWLTGAELSGGRRALAWAAVWAVVRGRGGRNPGQRKPKPPPAAAPGSGQDGTRTEPGIRQDDKAEPAQVDAKAPGSCQDPARNTPGRNLAGVPKKAVVPCSVTRPPSPPPLAQQGEGLDPSTGRRRRKPGDALIEAAARWLDDEGQSMLPLVYSRNGRFAEDVRKVLKERYGTPSGTRSADVEEALVIAAERGAGSRPRAVLPQQPAPLPLPDPRPDLVERWTRLIELVRADEDEGDGVVWVDAWAPHAAPTDFDGAVLVVDIRSVAWIGHVDESRASIDRHLTEVFGVGVTLALQPPLHEAPREERPPSRLHAKRARR